MVLWASLDILVQVVRVPTCTGLERSTVSPKPNCPRALYPQDQRVPSVLVAVVFWYAPADTLSQVVRAPTCTGLDLVVVSPRPNCPLALYPQDHKVPSVLVATVSPNILSLVAETLDQVVRAPTCLGLE